ncbi:MAG: hypothetical protein NT029_22045 [Armatimonadetes bacterium]|nr:hypothetical protein [Armatimonadota bacterium]
MSNLGHPLTRINRHWLYGALLAIVVIGLIVPISLPLAVSPEATRFYEAIESAPKDKLVLVSTLWSASTQGENRPQTQVVLKHLMKRHLRFALIAFGDAQATTLAQELAEEQAAIYKYEYGKDWINLGYRQDIAGTLKGMVRNINETLKTDSVNRRPLAEYPVMAGVRNVKDLSVIAEFSASGNYKSWVGLVVGSTDAAFCYAPTSVMAPELYTYLDSGQIRGMLFGIKGAAEYEQMMNEKGFTTRAITPVSLALVLLFVLIGLGNYGMYATKKMEGNS